MIRVLAILWTAFVCGLTAVGALTMLQMSGASRGACLGLLACAALLAVVCVGLIVQGMYRGPSTESSAALVATAGPVPVRPATKVRAGELTAGAHDSGKARASRRADASGRSDRLRTESHGGEDLLNAGSQEEPK